MCVLFSCMNKKKDSKKNEHTSIIKTAEIYDLDVYDDINLFRLEGVNGIKKPVKYPYIKIEKVNDIEKRIVYKISNNDSIESRFKLENGYWASQHEWKTDTGYAITYQYIKPDKIIELDYQGTYRKKDYRLHSASLYEKGNEIAYSYFGEKGIIENPKPENFQILKSNANAVYKTSYETKEGLLKVISNYWDNKEARMFFSDTSCYKTNGHSHFWWKYFGGQKTNCD
jgi:hypothetical protein